MKKLIIAGNAPSLKEIDYQRLPDDFEVFRCNQFYFEDKYYLGNKIKAVFYTPVYFFEQYYTLKHLIKNKEYEVDLIFCSNSNLPDDGQKFTKDFYAYFPDATLISDYAVKLKEFDIFYKFNAIYLNQVITSGIYMCAVAIALGYKEIYLAGIDFYNNGTTYAFDMKQENLLKLIPAFKNDNAGYSKHNKDIDIETLLFLKETYDVRFYCLCPNSPLANVIELAPPQLTNRNFKLQNKKDNYTKDILIPSKEAYENFPAKLKPIKLKQNIYYKLVQDFFKLPSHIKHYIRLKK